MRVKCPYCGERDKAEFSAHHEAFRGRPRNPSAASDAAWADYLFFHTNKKGEQPELWRHTFGCRRYFYVMRDTRNDRGLYSFELGTKNPREKSPGKKLGTRSSSAGKPASKRGRRPDSGEKSRPAAKDSAGDSAGGGRRARGGKEK